MDMPIGSTDPDAYVTLRGEPLTLRPDGTFTIRMQLANRRQVIPVVVDTPARGCSCWPQLSASAEDGAGERCNASPCGSIVRSLPELCKAKR